MKFFPLPAFQDNSLWLLHDGHRARVRDRGDAGPVLAGLQHHGLQLEAILVTHHVTDPIGALDERREKRAPGKPTLPSSIGRGRCIRPLMRPREPAIIEAATAFDTRTTQDQGRVFATVRQWKNKSR
jgi:hypothetical protein